MAKVTEKTIRKKRKIVEKTSGLLKKTKFESLTVQMICEEAEISVGTFYHYFACKDDLIAELFALLDEYLLTEVAGKLDSPQEAVNVARFCRGYAEYMAACGYRYSQVLNSVFPCRTEETRAWEKERPFFTLPRNLLVRGMEKKQFNAAYDPDMLTDMMLVMLRGYCFDWARRHGEYDLVRSTEAYAEIFIRVLCLSL